MMTTPDRPDASLGEDERSDLRVVLQFFIVPLGLVAVLVLVFFGLQFLRSRRPEPGSTLKSLRGDRGFLARFVGDLKRWQYGYDLSLFMRSQDAEGIRRLLPELIRAFGEAGLRRDLKLRRYLALALGHSRDPRAVEPLRDGIRDADAQTRLFSAWGLMQIGEQSALADLRAALADADPGVRKMVTFALGEMADAQSAPALREALADPEPDVRWNAALSLARLGDGAAIPVLMSLLEESQAPPTPRREMALNAIRGLALLKPPAARDLMGRLAASAPDPEIRAAAGLALASYGPASASPP